MGRKHAIIIYPSLKDCGGDLSKKWYVEYHWRVPGEKEPRRERIYKGLCEGTAEERRSIAAEIIREKTEWLKSGAHLDGNPRKVYEDELMYRNEAKLYGKTKNDIITIRTNLSEFLAFKKPQLSDKSYTDYQSKMRCFCAWLEQNELDQMDIVNFSQEHITNYAISLAKKGLSRVYIDKHIQIVRAFFNFEITKKNIQVNPAMQIPKMGAFVDCAAVPFDADERTRLKNAIKKRDPQLWLACQIQYYSAIRPGTEIRLMKVGYIDFDNKQFRIPNFDAKNRTTEIVEIPDLLFCEMKDYKLDIYDKKLYIFGNNGIPGENPVGKNTLRNRFNRYRDALGIPENRKFYSWKHTGAIQLIENGAKPYDLMEHLRHKDFATTEKYLRKRVKLKDKRINSFSSEI